MQYCRSGRVGPLNPSWVVQSRRAPYKPGHPAVVAKDVFPELGIEVLVAQVFLKKQKRELRRKLLQVAASSRPQAFNPKP